MAEYGVPVTTSLDDEKIRAVEALKRQFGGAPQPEQSGGVPTPTAPENPDITAYKEFAKASKGMYPAKTPEELQDEKRKRVLGMIASAVVGGLMNKGTAAGGGAGAGAAVQGFDQGFEPTAANANTAALGSQAGAVKSLMELRGKRMGTSVGQRPPAIIATFQAIHNRPPQNEKEFFDFVSNMRTHQNAARRNAVIEQFNAWLDMSDENKKKWKEYQGTKNPMAAILPYVFPDAFKSQDGGGNELDNLLTQ
jgi:hypothetical protein